MEASTLLIALVLQYNFSKAGEDVLPNFQNLVILIFWYEFNIYDHDGTKPSKKELFTSDPLDTSITCWELCYIAREEQFMRLSRCKHLASMELLTRTLLKYPNMKIPSHWQKLCRISQTSEYSNNCTEKEHKCLQADACI